MTAALSRTVQVCAQALRTEALEALLHGSPQAVAAIIDPPDHEPTVRLVQLISVAARIRLLKAAIDETQALAVVLVLDGFIKGQGEALLTVTVGRDGSGKAEALPYRRGALAPTFRPIQSSPEILRHYHKQLFLS